MLMFRSRRQASIKRLCKAGLLGHEESREVTQKLATTLTDKQLEMLWTAVESRDGTATECVLVERDAYDVAPLAACQLWRWRDLDSQRALKKLPMCSSAEARLCCNPFHWSRLSQPESPPPPYSRFSSERLKPEDRAPSESSQLELRGSLSTNGEDEYREEGQWCKLAYWELAQRVGRQFSVEKKSINVFWDVPNGNGLSLRMLPVEPCSHIDVLKAREKIGQGVTLSKEEDGIWAYNRSDCPMFVNSPALDDPDTRSLMVHRVAPGDCLNIFSDSARRRPAPVSRPHVGPIDPNSVRISFAKGWGPKYSRQEVTACPTWLEILLSPCR